VAQISNELVTYFKELNLPGLTASGNTISIPAGVILELKGSKYTLNFYIYNERDRQYTARSSPALIFDDNFDVTRILSNPFGGYAITKFSTFKPKRVFLYIN
jgi:hypothetical protein